MPRLSEQVRLRLREEMARQELSQRDVAGILTWSQSRVAHLLTGHVEMSIDDLAEFAQAVGVPPTEIIRDRGMEFCAEMSPTELRFLERMRQLTTDTTRWPDAIAQHRDDDASARATGRANQEKKREKCVMNPR
jgi:transcriptional regulator with XRE-family HTH domain